MRSKNAKSNYWLRYVCLPVSPYIRMEQLSFNEANFHEIRSLSIFRKSVEKVQGLLKSEKNNR